MPNVRLRLADGLPLIIPAHTVRLIETLGPGDNPNFPDAKAGLFYDLGDKDGLQSALLATSGEVVAEQVIGDPRFLGRLEALSAAGGRRIWIMPQHAVAIAGHRPPSAEDLTKSERSVATAEAELAKLDAADTSPAAIKAREDVAKLRTAFENLKSFEGVHAKLNIAIPHREGAMHQHYFLTEDADAVWERLFPPAARAPSIDAHPAPAPKRPRHRLA